jgi:adenylate cyclase
MSEGSGENPGRRLAEAATRFNRNPKLVEMARRTRKLALGDEELAELRGDAPGFLGELGLTALQAWQRLAESQDRGRGKVDLAILFTDLVGFSSWALEAGDQAAIRLLGEVAGAIEPPIVERRGEVVKHLGDGLMAVFRDAPSAVEAAFVAHDRLAPLEVDGYRPRLRTGIHLGRPRKLGGDYLGVDVNIAARLVEAAKPGEILVSDRVLERLEPGATEAKKRRFHAKGAPKGLGAHAVTRSANRSRGGGQSTLGET